MIFEENHVDSGKDKEQKRRTLLMGIRLMSLYGGKEHQADQNPVVPKIQEKPVLGKTSVVKRLHQKLERAGK